MVPRPNRNAPSSCKTGNHRLSSRLADAHLARVLRGHSRPSVLEGSYRVQNSGPPQAAGCGVAHRRSVAPKNGAGRAAAYNNDVEDLQVDSSVGISTFVGHIVEMSSLSPVIPILSV